MSEVNIQTNWVDKHTFISTNADNQSLIMDAQVDAQDFKKAPTPMEVVLMGLTGCAGIDVKMILSKARQQVRAIRIEATGERADAVPSVYTKIHLHFTVTGKDLTDKQVARAVQLSAEKYCSVSKMLENSVAISHDYEVLQTD
ncbi:OsmC family protein [Marinicella gelatinilytica]|uniref:OsmC family protein n=1 Tax=Marinicella gelatinilytica TaxID=2996017 RepID=UPI0022608396|nr:OsmC family protein [Marinicella gelatinilytica]MCX7545368.1 OsmC family protein [Marinicella gelatinilytica]